MTDRTHPDSGSIISSSDILLHDAKTALMYEELRAAIDDGHESMTHADALAEIAAIRAENVELRAQLESIAASAGSEPVARVNDDGFIVEIGDLLIAPGQKLYLHPSPPEGMVGGWQDIATAPKDGTEILLHAPACDYEGTYVQARTTYGRWRAPSDTPRIKYQDGFAPEPEWEDFEPFWASWDGGFTEEHPPTHWMPLPPPPISSADSRKGE